MANQTGFEPFSPRSLTFQTPSALQLGEICNYNHITAHKRLSSHAAGDCSVLEKQFRRVNVMERRSKEKLQHPLDGWQRNRERLHIRAFSTRFRRRGADGSDALDANRDFCSLQIKKPDVNTSGSDRANLAKPGKALKHVNHGVFLLSHL